MHTQTFPAPTAETRVYGRNYLLKSVKIGNFKAMRSSRRIALKPFTVLIGDNGSGKSILSESLQTHQAIVLGGLSKCFAEGPSFQDLLNKPVGSGKPKAMDFGFASRLGGPLIDWTMQLQARESAAGVGIAAEQVRIRGRKKEDGCTSIDRESVGKVSSDRSFLARLQGGAVAGAGDGGHGERLHDYIAGWKFVALAPEKMGGPAAAAGKLANPAQ